MDHAGPSPPPESWKELMLFSDPRNYRASPNNNWLIAAEKTDSNAKDAQEPGQNGLLTTLNPRESPLKINTLTRLLKELAKNPQSRKLSPSLAIK